MTRPRTGAIEVDAMIEDLRTLVEVESPSRDVAALTASARAVTGIIEARLGGQPVLIESGAGRTSTGLGVATPRC